MKKSLIALAVASVVSAPAFAATSNVDVYGVMNIAIQDTDVSGVKLDVVDNSSRIGFKGSEDLGGGLKAVWQIEQSINATGSGATGVTSSSSSSSSSACTVTAPNTCSVTTTTNTTTTNSGVDGAFGGGGLRNTFIGLAGSFGTALIGRHDTPYKIATGKYDIFADTIADYNSGRVGVSPVNAMHDQRATNAIAYISPNFSGLTIAAAVVTSDDALTANASGNSSLNVVDDTVDATSIAAMYANGPLTVDVAYQSVEDYSDAWKIGVGYSFGDASVGFVYEDSDEAQDQKGWLINGKYTMGPIVLKAIYGQADVGAADQDMWAIGADYNLSKRTSAYVVYASGDQDVGSAGERAGWNIGMKHSF